MSGPSLRHIVVIDGHPDSDPSRYVHALARSAYAAGAEESGMQCVVWRSATWAFPLITDRKTWEGEDLPPAIREAQEAITWAEHLLIIYPLWLGDMPRAAQGLF